MKVIAQVGALCCLLLYHWYAMVVFQNARICPIKRVVVVVKCWTWTHVLYIKRDLNLFKQFAPILC